MLDIITENGGYIDELYYSPHLEEEQSSFRKPNPGMGLAAKSDFAEIDFRKSVMVGDSLSDMQFGKTLGMKTVLLKEYSKIKQKEYEQLVDCSFYNLMEFANSITNHT
jgi:HAD superfamily hydrolase (TIGR01662 family)